MAYAKIAGLLLAAGRGSRFGGNKVEAMLDGAPLALHSARVLAGAVDGGLVAVCATNSKNLRSGLVTLNYCLVTNDDPDVGLSHSLALGLAAIKKTDVEAVLICLGDMPDITATHLEILITTYRTRDHAVASRAGAVRSPPAIFPRRDWPALLAKSGDFGARHHLATAIPVDTAADILFDIDERPDLAKRQKQSR
jgi:molybdenum cofactor cytidylyltransferase